MLRPRSCPTVLNWHPDSGVTAPDRSSRRSGSAVGYDADGVLTFPRQDDLAPTSARQDALAYARALFDAPPPAQHTSPTVTLDRASSTCAGSSCLRSASFPELTTNPSETDRAANGQGVSSTGSSPR